jgi:transcriptional regulator with XRE-family HTH domain
VNVLGVGEFIRTQRRNAKLSLSKVSGLAGVSIPYLSQVERGLRKPSADVLQAIAKGLRISAETLYIQAGFLEDRPVPDVTTSILADPTITERQKQALVQIYEAFRDETGRAAEAGAKVAASGAPAGSKLDGSATSLVGPSPAKLGGPKRTGRKASASAQSVAKKRTESKGRVQKMGPLSAVPHRGAKA